MDDKSRARRHESYKKSEFENDGDGGLDRICGGTLLELSIGGGVLAKLLSDAREVFILHPGAFSSYGSFLSGCSVLLGFPSGFISSTLFFSCGGLISNAFFFGLLGGGLSREGLAVRALDEVAFSLGRSLSLSLVLLGSVDHLVFFRVSTS